MDSGENVHNLIAPAVHVPPKPLMYTSKHPGEVLSPSALHKTFGKAKGMNKPSPQNFLRSHVGEPMLPEPTAVSNPKVKVKPAVPSRTEKPLMGLQSSKNFVTANAIETILSETKKTREDPVQYAKRSGYGKVPKYLANVKQQIAEEKEQIAATIAATQAAHATQQGSMTVMPEEERQDLLRQLKQKWASVNEMYQKMPFTMDTPSMKARKQKYEDQLTQLERDIELLSKQTIIIADY